MTPEELSQHLTDLGIDRHSSKALALLPAVEVAWADGKVDASEVSLILHLADERFHLGEEGARLLTDWLKYPPSASYLQRGYTALKTLARTQASGFNAQTVPQVIEIAQQVAQSSGGVGCMSYFRLGAISRKESSILSAVTERLAKELQATISEEEDVSRWAKRVTVMFDPDEDTMNDETGPEMVGVVIVETEASRDKLAVGDKPLLVGTTEAAQLRFAGDGVAPEHCRVFQRRRRFYVEDLGSPRGTFVQGERVGERRLLGGETIQVGQRTFMFKMARKG